MNILISTVRQEKYLTGYEDWKGGNKAIVHRLHDCVYRTLVFTLYSEFSKSG